MRCFVWIVVLQSALLAQQSRVPATVSSDPRPFTLISPAAPPTVSPGQILLLELEGRFQQEVAAGGGKAFSSWFAEDAVALNNGEPARLGRGVIAADAQWSAAEYQLNWTPQGAQMGPSNDMGFTWGHYQSRYKTREGRTLVKSGRYFTVWKKLPGEVWKVALDASANDEAVESGRSALPKP